MLDDKASEEEVLLFIQTIRRMRRIRDFDYTQCMTAAALLRLSTYLRGQPQVLEGEPPNTLAESDDVGSIDEKRFFRLLRHCYRGTQFPILFREIAMPSHAALFTIELDFSNIGSAGLAFQEFVRLFPQHFGLENIAELDAAIANACDRAAKPSHQSRKDLIYNYIKYKYNNDGRMERRNPLLPRLPNDGQEPVGASRFRRAMAEMEDYARCPSSFNQLFTTLLNEISFTSKKMHSLLEDGFRREDIERLVGSTGLASSDSQFRCMFCGGTATRHKDKVSCFVKREAPHHPDINWESVPWRQSRIGRLYLKNNRPFINIAECWDYGKGRFTHLGGHKPSRSQQGSNKKASQPYSKKSFAARDGHRPRRDQSSARSVGSTHSYNSSATGRSYRSQASEGSYRSRSSDGRNDSHRSARSNDSYRSQSNASDASRQSHRSGNTDRPKARGRGSSPHPDASKSRASDTYRAQDRRTGKSAAVPSRAGHTGSSTNKGRPEVKEVTTLPLYSAIVTNPPLTLDSLRERRNEASCDGRPPAVEVRIDGISRLALLDTGSVKLSYIRRSLANSYRDHIINMNRVYARVLFTKSKVPLTEFINYPLLQIHSHSVNSPVDIQYDMRDTLMCIVDDDKLPYDIIIGLPDIRRHDLTTRFRHLFLEAWPAQGTRVAKDKLLTKDVDTDCIESDDNTDLPDPLPWDDMWYKVLYAT